MAQNTIFGINGPVITVKNTKDFFMQETVLVGEKQLIGEVIGISADYTVIQVYEETVGIKTGEPVVSTGMPMSVTLGPGIVGGIYDGIERPLSEMEKESGAFITVAQTAPPISIDKKWDVTVTVKAGDILQEGAIFCNCPETKSILFFGMLPPDVSGEVVFAAPNGKYTVDETIVTIKTQTGEQKQLTLAQKWSIRKPRPYKKRLEPTVPLVTGQRVIDSVFPIAKGGTAAIPGGFGTGKTMTQHQIAKWSDADLIVYVGCGERGNEMTQVLEEFSQLKDPRNGELLTDRTILIANTSNMPVAAREASIYTGITIAEFYRDMGYNVAMMADSTSRWAEALREISGRLEEMPAEEGFPAYLPSRLSDFYERAGRVISLSGMDGSVSIIGAVSPQGSDFSEPVTQNTKRFTRVFWALDKSLAYARHYPAINWLDSYSEYAPDLTLWYETNIGSDFMSVRREMITLLREEGSLMEIVKLIGADVLPDDQKLIIDIARVFRLGFLQQNAFHNIDTYVPLKKQYLMMKTILHLYNESKKLINRSIPVSRIADTGLYEELISIKYEIDNDNTEAFEKLTEKIDNTLSVLE